MISPPRPGFLVAVVLAALAGAGCASMSNTLAQDLAQERWEKCKDVARQVQLKEIRPNGQIRITYFSGEDLRAVNACLDQAQAAPGATQRCRGGTRSSGGGAHRGATRTFSSWAFSPDLEERR